MGWETTRKQWLQRWTKPRLQQQFRAGSPLNTLPHYYWITNENAIFLTKNSFYGLLSFLPSTKFSFLGNSTSEIISTTLVHGPVRTVSKDRIQDISQSYPASLILQL